MQKLKPCMVQTHNDEALCREVLKISKDAGYSHSLVSNFRAPGYVFGVWAVSLHKPHTVLHAHIWGDSLFNQHPDWPRFDARTQMEQILEHFGASPSEPEFDESPLPNDMKKEKQEEIRIKFNLSPEQWEMMPPSVRDALDKSKVTIKVTKLEYVWHPISEPKRNSDTVVVCRGDGRDGLDDGGKCGIGCFYDREYQVISGEENPTHWADIPSE